MKRTNVLGVGVSSLNMKETIKTLLDARANQVTGYVCVTGVHGVIESQRDPVLREIHNRSFLTVPDGMPTVWMGREQGFVHMCRVYGPDLMLGLMAATSEGESTGKKCFTHFLYGATEDMLSKLKANLEERFPGVRIVGTYAPPFRPLNEDEEKELREIVTKCRPDFFWVGLSTPKQEKFMAAHTPLMEGKSMVSGTMNGDKAPNNQHLSGEASAQWEPATESIAKRNPLDAGIMLGVGAAFPIHAGEQKDAPQWIKNSGMQWLHRLCQEPGRLWRRYLDIVPTFLWLAALQLLGIKKYALKGGK